MSPVSGSNVLAAQGCRPQSSSLIKIPLNFTDGGSEVKGLIFSDNELLCSGVASAHQCHGVTPIRSEILNTPKAVPRSSLPVITNALLMFLKGFAITFRL